MAALAVVVGIWIICVIWVIILLCDVPEGYEDETGFHYGRKYK